MASLLFETRIVISRILVGRLFAYNVALGGTFLDFGIQRVSGTGSSGGSFGDTGNLGLDLVTHGANTFAGGIVDLSLQKKR